MGTAAAAAAAAPMLPGGGAAPDLGCAFMAGGRPASTQKSEGYRRIIRFLLLRPYLRPFNDDFEEASSRVGKTNKQPASEATIEGKRRTAVTPDPTPTSVAASLSLKTIARISEQVCVTLRTLRSSRRALDGGHR